MTNAVSAIVFGRIGFDVGPRKLVVFRTDRTDLPHLTCSWNNASGEVDLHLTPTSPCDGEHREPLLKIQESELKGRFRDLVGRIVTLVSRSPIQIVWGVHPKWLAARGFVLLGPTNQPFSEWFHNALQKRRGKYRLDERIFRRMPKMGVYTPTARNFAKLGSDGQMHAVCTKGSHRRTVLMLARLDSAALAAPWVAFDFLDLLNVVRKFERRRIIREWFASFAPAVWDRTHAALRLDELGQEHRTARCKLSEQARRPRKSTASL